MNRAREKAIELHEKFQQYEWKDSEGWVCDDNETKIILRKVIEEIQEHTQMIDTPYEGYPNAYEFFKAVSKEIKTL